MAISPYDERASDRRQLTIEFYPAAWRNYRCGILRIALYTTGTRSLEAAHRALSLLVMFKIGMFGSANMLREMTEPLGRDFWSNFRPAAESELQAVESQLERTLDPEFREFYRTIGYGAFPNFGGFYSPDDLLLGAGPSIYFITGSMSPGNEWASPDEHTRLWISRGRENPNPNRFTEETLTLEGVKLYDLLQFGSNGSCCYHQLYVGPDPAPLRYCLLTDSQTIEDRSTTFSEGVERIITLQLPNTDEPA